MHNHAFFEELSKEIGAASLLKTNRGEVYKVRLEGQMEVLIREIHSSFAFYFFALLGEYDGQGREELFLRCLQANVLGEGTLGAVLGTDFEEKVLTLSQIIWNFSDGKHFCRELEQFVNVLDFWRGELSLKESTWPVENFLPERLPQIEDFNS